MTVKVILGVENSMLRALIIGILLLPASLAAVSPTALSYECGPVSTYWQDDVECDLFCNQYHYLYVSVSDSNTNHYVNGAVYCGGDSGGCGAYGSCSLWTTQGALYQENGVGNCQATRQYVLSTLTVYCKATGVRGSSSPETLDLMPIEGITVRMEWTPIGVAAVRCVTHEGRTTCAPVAAACDVLGLTQVCRADFF